MYRAIGFQEEEEKFNVWISYINMEYKYGDMASLDAVFKRAVMESKGKRCFFYIFLFINICIYICIHLVYVYIYIYKYTLKCIYDPNRSFDDTYYTRIYLYT
jgi:hypothetical protein